MEKFNTQPIGENQRSSSFYKNAKNIEIDEVGQLPPLKIQEVKTLKMITKKPHKIPFLNLADVKHQYKPRVLSLNCKEPEKLRTDRKATHGSTQDVSFFLHQCDLLITKKNSTYLKDLRTTTKNSIVLPPIIPHGHTSPLNFQKRLQNSQNTQELKKKAPRTKAHCKVLLAKNNDFPFIGSHVYENRKIERVKTKQSLNPQQIDFFALDISRISGHEMSNIDFISQESFKQIPIF